MNAGGYVQRLLVMTLAARFSLARVMKRGHRQRRRHHVV
jgi:hypothetical protein